jgi:hypothetical protein
MHQKLVSNLGLEQKIESMKKTSFQGLIIFTITIKSIINQFQYFYYETFTEFLRMIYGYKSNNIVLMGAISCRDFKIEIENVANIFLME